MAAPLGPQWGHSDHPSRAGSQEQTQPWTRGRTQTAVRGSWGGSQGSLFRGTWPQAPQSGRVYLYEPDRFPRSKPETSPPRLRAGGGESSEEHQSTVLLNKAWLQGKLANQCLTSWALSELNGLGEGKDPSPASSSQPDLEGSGEINPDGRKE